MYTESDGIILRQIKMAEGRRMILLFSKKFGKISAGTTLSERSKGKSALLIRPFTFGRYELNKNREIYHLNGGEVKKSHFALGEDVDKFLQASYTVELTEKLLPENEPSPETFVLLSDYLDMMDERTKKYETITLAYTVKLLALSGSKPETERCVCCGERENLSAFSIDQGGTVCSKCELQIPVNERLISGREFDIIIKILRYLLGHPLRSFEKLALDESSAEQLRRMLRLWLEYHLEIRDLKSEAFF